MSNGTIAVVSTSTGSLDYYDKPIPDNISILRARTMLNGKKLEDATDIKADDFNRWMLDHPDELAKTEPPDFNQIAEHLLNLQKEGHSEVLIVTLAKNLSNCFDNCNEVADLYENKLKVSVFDTGMFSIAEGAFALKAAKMAKAGKDLMQIRNTLELMKRNCAIYMLVDNLHYLAKNGWLSLSMNVLGTLFNVKPVLKQKDSSLEVFQKLYSTGKAIEDFAAFINSQLDDPNSAAFGLYGGDKRLFLELQDKVDGLGPERSYPMTPSIGAHVGPRVVGVAVFQNTDMYDLDV